MKTKNVTKLILISVSLTTNTGIGTFYSLAMLSDNTGVICGDEPWTRKIQRYDLQTGAELNCLNLEDAWGLAEVKLGGKLALAVSYP